MRRRNDRFQGWHFMRQLAKLGGILEIEKESACRCFVDGANDGIISQRRIAGGNCHFLRKGALTSNRPFRTGIFKDDHTKVTLGVIKVRITKLRLWFQPQFTETGTEIIELHPQLFVGNINESSLIIKDFGGETIRLLYLFNVDEGARSHGDAILKFGNTSLDHIVDSLSIVDSRHESRILGGATGSTVSSSSFTAFKRIERWCLNNLLQPFEGEKVDDKIQQKDWNGRDHEDLCGGIEFRHD
mmetsp:Transcript_22681/g.37525  ORF Transcript_22681/g.37525 Transcript_22681/m.37525 type:complete len:243 (+) Transcript_22681:1523-2251(+)